MAAAAAPLGALTLSVKKASALAVNDVIFGVLDEFNRGRVYLPFTWGYVPQTGDAANKWLPQVSAVTQTTYDDGLGVNDPHGGPFKVTLVPGSADQVNVASVQTMTVDQNAFFLVATGSF